MSQVAQPPVGRRTRVAPVAAVAAGAVAAALFVQDVIGRVIWVMLGNAYDTTSGQDYWGYLWQDFAFGNLMVLAFAAGVWFSLWRFAPVTRESGTMVVVLRGLLAAAVGGVLVFLVKLGFNLIWPLSGVGSLFGNSFPGIPWGGIAQAVNGAFYPASTAFLQQGPVVLLVVLLVWIWLGRHPSEHAVSADTAEV